MTDLIAEVAEGPAGAHIGAFFDLDGTLIDGFTPSAHARHRIRNRQAKIGELFGILEAALRYRWGRMEFDRLLVRAAGYLRGTGLAELEELGEQLFEEQIRPRLHTEMLRLIGIHQDLGHTVVLSSSALTIHAGPVARGLAIPHLICNHFEVDAHGRLTGDIVTPIIWGARKAAAATDFSARHGVALEHSYFYADGDEDAALMRRVGNPRPVNPRPGLAAAADEHGWPILRVGGAGRRPLRIGLNTWRGRTLRGA
ncbi:haloacid dehalogenase [Mycolicibacterium chitae]|uniref:Transmembrane phospholipid biosynthesis bifunctional enzyme plsC: putative l-3-phosphoserine phosphatase/ 1-acyl-SN-glycerol-3-phosphate acyltransferase n=1 Tax=Mycolicibacterium chitae TaxID=1792 RepID=A0A448HX34_MYCCI|nr:HAD family hydrolase [Mycolicibacterium chitae]BBZ02302.1 haloacid dehalogenase [Mycolicibacterium chitae]VEG44620.1 transmembrane phospholipid biosynthesis bifunctional enzyme plsC: putative l-3-phosphoserine phosphatase/ 1-acyl-SN-glycerol-3-phosphate acyltransferase [Mycolicibacterium chitae]